MFDKFLNFLCSYYLKEIHENAFRTIFFELFVREIFETRIYCPIQEILRTPGIEKWDRSEQTLSK